MYDYGALAGSWYKFGCDTPLVIQQGPGTGHGPASLHIQGCVVHLHSGSGFSVEGADGSTTSFAIYGPATLVQERAVIWVKAEEPPALDEFPLHLWRSFTASARQGKQAREAPLAQPANLWSLLAHKLRRRQASSEARETQQLWSALAHWRLLSQNKALGKDSKLDALGPPEVTEQIPRMLPVPPQKQPSAPPVERVRWQRLQELHTLLDPPILPHTPPLARGSGDSIADFIDQEACLIARKFLKASQDAASSSNSLDARLPCTTSVSLTVHADRWVGLLTPNLKPAYAAFPRLAYDLKPAIQQRLAQCSPALAEVHVSVIEFSSDHVLVWVSGVWLPRQQLSCSQPKTRLPVWQADDENSLCREDSFCSSSDTHTSCDSSEPVLSDDDASCDSSESDILSVVAQLQAASCKAQGFLNQEAQLMVDKFLEACMQAAANGRTVHTASFCLHEVHPQREVGLLSGMQPDCAEFLRLTEHLKSQIELLLPPNLSSAVEIVSADEIVTLCVSGCWRDDSSPHHGDAPPVVVAAYGLVMVQVFVMILYILGGSSTTLNECVVLESLV